MYSPAPASRATSARSDSRIVARPITKNSRLSSSASVSMASAPAMIGLLSPGSQLAMVSPPAVSSDAAPTSGTSPRWTKRPGNRPTISASTAPPTSASTGDRPM